MAPEVLLRRQYSKAADVYAFGITLWELCHRKAAFGGVPEILLGLQVRVSALDGRHLLRVLQESSSMDRDPSLDRGLPLP